MKEIHLEIEGMSCINCVKSIREKLLDKSAPLVSEVNIGLLTKQAVVKPLPGVEVSQIIAAIEATGKKAKQISTDLMFTPSDALFFDITGLDSIHCEDTVRDILKNMKFASDVMVDFATQKMRVIPLEKISAKDIAEGLNKRNVAWNATRIPDKKETTLYFALSGLTEISQVENLKQALNDKCAYIKSYDINFSTKAATIVLPGNAEAEINHLREQLTKYVRQSTGILIEKDDTVKQEQATTEPRSSYVLNFVANLIMGLSLYLFSNAIPLPITPWGQLIGVALGLLNLGVMVWSGKEFYKNAWTALVNKGRSTMDTMITLGTGSAWVYSMVLILVPGLFPVAALQYQFLAIQMILGIINLGRAARSHFREQNETKLMSMSGSFVGLQPLLANRKKGDQLEQISYKEVKQGDILQVNPGERFPVDGRIINDVEADIDQAVFNGESGPCIKRKDDIVCAGSKNNGAMVEIKATQMGSEGTLVKTIKKLVKETDQAPPISKLVDKIAEYFVPIILTIAVLSSFGWFLIGPSPVLPFMLKSFMGVCLCACPCALGLATPISNAICMYKLADKGIIVRHASGIETLANVDVLVIDKTDTLTNSAIDTIYAPDVNYPKDKVELLAGSLEQYFEDPIARAFMKENTQLSPGTDCVRGESGVSGLIDGKKVVVGNARQLETWGIVVDKFSNKVREFDEEYNKTSIYPRSYIYVAVDGVCVALVALKHDPRKDARPAIKDVRELGIECIMATGDNDTIAGNIASKVNIKPENVYSDLTKEAKEQLVQVLKFGFNPKIDYSKYFSKDAQVRLTQFLKSKSNKPQVVAMLGDGMNDAGAAAKADVGIGAGFGSHVSASEKTHIAMQALNLGDLIKVARVTMRNIKQNLIWTLFYNLFTLVAATGLLYPLFGFVLPPVIASLSMGFSSVFVVLNSSRLAAHIDEALEKKQQDRSVLKAPLNFVRSFRLWTAMEMFLAFIWDRIWDRSKKSSPLTPPRPQQLLSRQPSPVRQRLNVRRKLEFPDNNDNSQSKNEEPAELRTSNSCSL